MAWLVERVLVRFYRVLVNLRRKAAAGKSNFDSIGRSGIEASEKLTEIETASYTLPSPRIARGKSWSNENRSGRENKMMNKKLWGVSAVLCMLAMLAVCGPIASAQMPEVKEKPPMYSYVGTWGIPRAQWADMDKQAAANQKLLDKALADGGIVGYGSDLNLIHESSGETHDNWWAAMSMAGVLNVLDQVYKSGSATSPVYASATKHWDGLFVSRYYNWHAGSWKDAYLRVASYKLKPDAPNDAVDMLSKNLFVPLLEKLLTDGAIHEYEIDTEAIHTEAPGTFEVVVILANAEALDKFNAAVQAGTKANPLIGPAIGSMVDFNPHRDYLGRATATFK